MKFLCFIFFYLVINYFKLSNSAMVRNDCSIQECRMIATEITEKMDENIQPCDNFYQFVCGKYIKNHAPTYTQLDLFDEMNTYTQNQLISLLERNYNKRVVKPFQQLSKLYNLCTDQSTLNKQGGKALREIFRELGGWPILDDNKWSEKNNDWETVAGRLVRQGFTFDLFMKFSIIESPGIGNHDRLIWIDQPVIKYKMDRKSVFNVNDFYDDVVKIATDLGIADKVDEIKEVKQFLINLNNITRTKANVQIMNLDDLSRKWPTINWKTYFSSLLSISSVAALDSSDRISVNELYINELQKLLNRTPSKVLMNYMLSTAAEESKDYIRLKSVTHTASSRSEICLSILLRLLPNAVDAMYALNYVDPVKRNEIVSMVNAFKDEYKKLIEEVEWLPEGLKGQAKEKVSSMSSRVGYLDEWNTEEWLNEYNGLEINGENFLRCALNVTRFKKSYQYQTGREHYEEKHRMLPIDRMPYYLSFDNTIIIPASFLQRILVDSKLPKYINYARIGLFIGHEIIHILDNIRELAKKDGSLSKSTRDEFREETECFINQYNDYNIAKINKKVNGNETVQENIADNSGIKLAYLTYKKEISQSEPTLPNLNYTSAQMFWINMAIPWCTNVHPNFLKQQGSDPHSPAEFRVIGVVSNNIDFSRDFSCQMDSKMNRMRKCSVW